MTSSEIKLFARKGSGHCAHCGLRSAFQEVARHDLAPRWNAAASQTSGAFVVQQVMQCIYCYGASVYLLYFDASDAAGSRPASRIKQAFPAPSPRDLDPAVPQGVRSLFHEAAISEVHGALRAAAVMYRSSVEAMCNDLNVSGANLYRKIEALTDQGLDRPVVDDLHEARMLGNDSIHDGLIYSADEVADVADLIEEAFNILYVQPAGRRALRQRRLDRRNGVSSPSSTSAFPVDGHLPAGRSGAQF